MVHKKSKILGPLSSLVAVLFLGLFGVMNSSYAVSDQACQVQADNLVEHLDKAKKPPAANKKGQCTAAYQNALFLVDNSCYSKGIGPADPYDEVAKVCDYGDLSCEDQGIVCTDPVTPPTDREYACKSRAVHEDTSAGYVKLLTALDKAGVNISTEENLTDSPNSKTRQCVLKFFKPGVELLGIYATAEDADGCPAVGDGAPSQPYILVKDNGAIKKWPNDYPEFDPEADGEPFNALKRDILASDFENQVLACVNNLFDTTLTTFGGETFGEDFGNALKDKTTNPFNLNYIRYLIGLSNSVQGIASNMICLSDDLFYKPDGTTSYTKDKIFECMVKKIEEHQDESEEGVSEPAPVAGPPAP